MKSGSLVSLKSGASPKIGVVLDIMAGPGSFATWAEIMWPNGVVETLNIDVLIEKSPKGIDDA